MTEAQKHRSPAQLEILAKAREKAQQVRKENAELRRKEKELAKAEKEKEKAERKRISQSDTANLKNLKRNNLKKNPM